MHTDILLYETKTQGTVQKQYDGTDLSILLLSNGFACWDWSKGCRQFPLMLQCRLPRPFTVRIFYFLGPKSINQLKKTANNNYSSGSPVFSYVFGEAIS